MNGGTAAGGWQLLGVVELCPGGCQGGGCWWCLMWQALGLVSVRVEGEGAMVEHALRQVASHGGGLDAQVPEHGV